MKKLLATSALVGAAALFAGSAVAAPTVTVGGHANFQVGVSDQDNVHETGVHSRNTKFRNDTEVNVGVENQADNGLVYGAVIELEADVSDADDNEGVNADKTYIYMQGQFGRVELGANTDAGAALKVDAASIARATGGIDGDFYHYVNVAGTGTGVNAGAFIVRPDLPTAHALGAREDANKVTYYSPRFSGVQVGVSYTPDSGDVGSATGWTGDSGVDQENVFNAGVNYTGQYNELGVAASLTGEFGDSEVGTREDLSAWALGGSATYRGFSLAGSYGDWSESEQLKTGSEDSSYWTLGAAYEQGPAGISVTYLDSEFRNNDFTNVSVGADYKLAPGLVPYVEVSFFELDAVGTGAVNSNDGTVFLVGTELSF